MKQGNSRVEHREHTTGSHDVFWYIQDFLGDEEEEEEVRISPGLFESLDTGLRCVLIITETRSQNRTGAGRIFGEQVFHGGGVCCKHAFASVPQSRSLDLST